MWPQADTTLKQKSVKAVSIRPPIWQKTSIFVLVYEYKSSLRDESSQRFQLCQSDFERCHDLKGGQVHLESNGDFINSSSLYSKEPQNRTSVPALLLLDRLIQYFYCYYIVAYSETAATLQMENMPHCFFNIKLVRKDTTCEHVKF